MKSERLVLTFQNHLGRGADDLSGRRSEAKFSTTRTPEVVSTLAKRNFVPVSTAGARR